ncbi:hypothetical protein BDA99DRAFT_239636 [Phascolomyces articulosus]|uniref:F-box domain-containing protein n=1 Tax=Phascolomyces articulosus TaxID=60185 RepID=A0AAD5PJU3_9FUNG|nr:hypothetical protein BDA99DRAFT_239636 [Phascolomyces articulosus]
MLRSSNSDTIKESSNKVGDTNDDRDYDAIIKQSTTALAEIYRTQHIALLDKRAFALGMKSQFREGLKDAQAMIKYAPDLITGYLRLGDLYLRQGMSRAAIDIYDRGLENLHPPAPPLPLPQQNGETNSSLVADDPKSYYIQLINARKAAVKQHESRIDFIQRLSTELTMNIFMHLPLSAKVICTQVSRIWRTKILRCSVAWRVIICDKSLTTDTSTAVCNLVARNDALGIGSHIRRLVLHCNDFSSENNNMKICQTYLDSMMNLRLTNIQELSISGNNGMGGKGILSCGMMIYKIMCLFFFLVHSIS